jgi:hypothetical protein
LYLYPVAAKDRRKLDTATSAVPETKFMLDLMTLPLRQKILIGLTLLAALFLMISSVGDLVKPDDLNVVIFLYGIGIPMFLLMLDTVVDLNDMKTFRIWFAIAIVLFAISLVSYKSDQFKLHRNAKFDPGAGVNSLIAAYSTSSLKTLLIFLIAYWPINKLMNRKGKYVINTFRQRNWYHDEAQRGITGVDVIINLFLYAVIILAALVGH